MSIRVEEFDTYEDLESRQKNLLANLEELCDRVRAGAVVALAGVVVFDDDAEECKNGPAAGLLLSFDDSNVERTLDGMARLGQIVADMYAPDEDEISAEIH